MKKIFIILPLAMLFCFIFSCQDKAAMEELKTMKVQAEVEEQNKALIRNFYKEWHKRNVDAMKELHAPNAKLYHASVGTTAIPIDKAMEMTKVGWLVFPDLTCTIKDLIAKDDKVVVRFIGQGTNTGTLGGIPATGNRCIAEAVEIFRIKGGKIVESWELSDRLGLMQQLGFELKPRNEEKKK